MLRKLVVVAALAAVQVLGSAPAEAVVCIEPGTLPCLCELSVRAGPVTLGPFINC